MSEIPQRVELLRHGIVVVGADAGVALTGAGEEAGVQGGICEVPFHVYLDVPLGGRTVIDGSTGEAVPYKNVWAEIEAEDRASRS